VGFAANEEILQSKLRVGGQIADEQWGFTRGIVPAFRNATHHHVTDALSKEDAQRISGFVAFLLRVVDGADPARAEVQSEA
jgi:hypothetical protein